MVSEPAGTAVTRAPARVGAPASVWEGVKDAVSMGNYIPLLRADLSWVRLRTRRGVPYTILAEVPRAYVRLSPEEEFLATRMDGTRRVSDLVLDYFNHFGRLGVDRVVHLVADLRAAGFLHDPARDIYQELRTRLHPGVSRSKREQWGKRLTLRWRLRGVDSAFTGFHNRAGWIFYTRPALLLTAAVSILGLLAYLIELAQGRDPFAPLGGSQLLGLAVLIIATYLISVVHESAHALTYKHFGWRVEDAGITLSYLIPGVYVKLPDASLDPWQRRIAVYWAGPYSGFVVGGIASLLVWLFPDAGFATLVLVKLAAAAYLVNTANLLPIIPLDGYYIVEEWLDAPRLRERALAFIKGPMWHRLLERQRFTRWEAFYAVFGVLCVVYSSVAIYPALLYWGRRLTPVVQPLWFTPDFLSKVVLGGVIAIVAITLGVQLGLQLVRYYRSLVRAPAAARKALEAVRVRERLRVLDGLAFLGDLPSASRERLARAARFREAPAGAAVVRQGERGDEFFVVLAGQAEVSVSASGEEKVVASLGPGDFFGERALLGSGVRAASVYADTPLKLLVLSRPTFWAELAGVVAWHARVQSALEERQRLAALPLFAEATARQLDLLAVKLEICRFDPGGVIVRQGEPGDAFYILRDGVAEATVAGTERVLSVMRPGDFFGEIALLHDSPRTATVRARTAGSAWRLGRSDFRDFFARYLGLEGQIAGVAAARLARGHAMAEVA